MFWLTDEKLNEYLNTKCANYTNISDYDDDVYQSSTESYNPLEPAYSSCPSGEVEIPNVMDYGDYAEVQTNPDGNGVHLVLKAFFSVLGIFGLLANCVVLATISFQGIRQLRPSI